MAIFNSYVSSPEGIAWNMAWDSTKTQWISKVLLLKTPVFPMVFQHFPMVSPWFPRPGHLHHVLPGGHRRCGAALGWGGSGWGAGSRGVGHGGSGSPRGATGFLESGRRPRFCDDFWRSTSWESWGKPWANTWRCQTCCTKRLCLMILRCMNYRMDIKEYIDYFVMDIWWAIN